jgi:chemotaxis protein CheX
MPPDLHHLLQSAAQAVFTTMLSHPVAFAASAPMPENASLVAGTIAFAGEFNGALFLRTSPGAARKITSHLLQMEESAMAEDAIVNDALGELTNMHAGHLKNRLVDQGYLCNMSIPTILRGDGIRIQPVTGMPLISLCFQVFENPVYLDLVLKPLKGK